MHQLLGRNLAFAVLEALMSAVNIWTEGVMGTFVGTTSLNSDSLAPLSFLCSHHFSIRNVSQRWPPARRRFMARHGLLRKYPEQGEKPGQKPGQLLQS
jgi:hypothetical protein